LTVTSSEFQSNIAVSGGTAFNVASPSNTLTVINSSFYRTVANGQSTIQCTSSTPVTQSGNSFCGYDLTNAINCNTWTPTPTSTTADFCDVCNGGDLNEDCSGTCFGYAQSTVGGCCIASARDCDGICNGPNRVDNLGTCCLGSHIDVNGVCCSGVLNCFGVCNGNSCTTGTTGQFTTGQYTTGTTGTTGTGQ